MTHLKALIHSLLIAQLSLGSQLAIAKPADKKASYVRATFDLIVAQSAMVKNAKDFERFLLYGMKPADRKAVTAALAKQKEFPTFKRVGDTLVVDNGLTKRSLRWPDIVKTEFEIEGVTWAYDSAKPFIPQYEKLQAAVAAKGKSASLFHLLVPEAEAVAFLVPVLMMLAGAVVGVVASDLATEGWCAAVGATESTTQKCIDLKKSKEGALFGDAPALDAVSNQAGSDNTNVLARFESQDWQCPTNSDGKPREYKGRIRTVETKDGQVTMTSNWFYVSAKFSPEGFPTDLIITRQAGDVDSSSSEAKEQLVIHITFDPTTKKPLSYRIPNPAYNPAEDLLGKPTITLMQNQKLTPEQTDTIEKAKDLIRFINYRNYNCVAQQVEHNKTMGIETVSPAGAKK